MVEYDAEDPSSWTEWPEDWPLGPDGVPLPVSAVLGLLVIVPCGGAKLGAPTVAERLYTGSFHRLCMRAGLALTGRDRVRILSGKYGLLRLTDPVEPYEQRINAPFSLAGVNVVEQAASQGLQGERPILLLPAAYHLVAAHAWPRNTNPLLGASGIGSMQHRLREIVVLGALDSRI